MRSQVQKWGNSLALRIPKSFAVESHLAAGTAVELTLEAGRLVVERAAESRYSLVSLLDQVTPDNLHREVEFGRAEGAEVW